MSSQSVKKFFPISIPSSKDFLVQYHAWIHGKVSRRFKKNPDRVIDSAQNVRLRLLSKDFVARWFFKHLSEELVDRSQAEKLLGGKPIAFIGKLSPVHGNRMDENSLWRVSDILRFTKFSHDRYFYSIQSHTIDSPKFLSLLGYKEDDFSKLESLYRQGKIKPSELTEHTCQEVITPISPRGFYCGVPGCDELHLSKGYCHRHYNKSRTTCPECDKGRAFLRSRGISLARRWTDPDIRPAIEKLRWNDKFLRPFLRDWKKMNSIKGHPSYIMRENPKNGIDAGLLKYAEMIIDNEINNDFKRMGRHDDMDFPAERRDGEFSTAEMVAWESSDDSDSVQMVIRDTSSMSAFSGFEHSEDLSRIFRLADLTDVERFLITSIDIDGVSASILSKNMKKTINFISRTRASALDKLRQVTDEILNFFWLFRLKMNWSQKNMSSRISSSLRFILAVRHLIASVETDIGLSAIQIIQRSFPKIHIDRNQAYKWGERLLGVAKREVQGNIQDAMEAIQNLFEYLIRSNYDFSKTTQKGKPGAKTPDQAFLNMLSNLRRRAMHVSYQKFRELDQSTAVKYADLLWRKQQFDSGSTKYSWSKDKENKLKTLELKLKEEGINPADIVPEKKSRKGVPKKTIDEAFGTRSEGGGDPEGGEGRLPSPEGFVHTTSQSDVQATREFLDDIDIIVPKLRRFLPDDLRALFDFIYRSEEEGLFTSSGGENQGQSTRFISWLNDQGIMPELAKRIDKRRGIMTDMREKLLENIYLFVYEHLTPAEFQSLRDQFFENADPHFVKKFNEHQKKVNYEFWRRQDRDKVNKLMKKMKSGELSDKDEKDLSKLLERMDYQKELGELEYKGTRRKLTPEEHKHYTQILNFIKKMDADDDIPPLEHEIEPEVDILAQLLYLEKRGKLTPQGEEALDEFWDQVMDLGIDPNGVKPIPPVKNDHRFIRPVPEGSSIDGYGRSKYTPSPISEEDVDSKDKVPPYDSGELLMQDKRLGFLYNIACSISRSSFKDYFLWTDR